MDVQRNGASFWLEQVALGCGFRVDGTDLKISFRWGSIETTSWGLCHLLSIHSLYVFSSFSGSTGATCDSIPPAELSLSHEARQAAEQLGGPVRRRLWQSRWGVWPAT